MHIPRIPAPVAVCLALLCLLAVAPAAQITPKGHLHNGGSFSGRIFPALDVDSYAFKVNQGETVLIRIADLSGSNLSPQITLYHPNGSVIDWGWGNITAGINFVAPVKGVYTLVVQDYNAGLDTGAYRIHYTVTPGANEHGALVNGGKVSQHIQLGDLDSFTFQANQDENVLLRMVDLSGTNLAPQMNVYKPDGSLLKWSWGNIVAGVDFVAPVTGTYSLVVMDYNIGADTGDYEIHFARTPSVNEHGSLVNGGSVTEHTDVGDLDSFVFNADQGDGVVLRAADLSGTDFAPQLNVYQPDGSLLNWTWGNITAGLAFSAPISGTYTVIVSDYNIGADSGAYEIHYTNSPGANEHGSLVNGGHVSETIDVGDLDSFTFDVSQDDTVLLRAVDTSGTNLSPEIHVYSPDGSLLNWSWGSIVAGLSFVVPTTGTYTLVVMDYNVGGDSGSYDVHYTRMPGANEHGALVNGGTVNGTIDVGDLDTFVFNVSQGDTVLMRAVDLSGTNLSPQINVYRPDGSLQTWSWGSIVAGIGFSAPMSGTYTLVVMDYNVGADSGAYEVHYTRMPGANEHGLLVNGGTVSQTIDVGDLDSYTFHANSGDSVHVQMTKTSGTNFVPQFNVYKPDGALQNWTWSNTAAILNFTAPTTGTYTLVGMDYNVGADSGTYEIYFSR